MQACEAEQYIDNDLEFDVETTEVAKIRQPNVVYINRLPLRDCGGQSKLNYLMQQMTDWACEDDDISDEWIANQLVHGINGCFTADQRLYDL